MFNSYGTSDMVLCDIICTYITLTINMSIINIMDKLVAAKRLTPRRQQEVNHDDSLGQLH